MPPTTLYRNLKKSIESKKSDPRSGELTELVWTPNLGVPNGQFSIAEIAAKWWGAGENDYSYHPHVYGIFVYLPTSFRWFIMVNVGKYTMHGWYGLWLIMFHVSLFADLVVFFWVTTGPRSDLETFLAERKDLNMVKWLPGSCWQLLTSGRVVGPFFQMLAGLMGWFCHGKFKMESILW